jgi:hypothetical protein
MAEISPISQSCIVWVARSTSLRFQTKTGGFGWRSGPSKIYGVGKVRFLVTPDSVLDDVGGLDGMAPDVMLAPS